MVRQGHRERICPEPPLAAFFPFPKGAADRPWDAVSGGKARRLPPPPVPWAEWTLLPGFAVPQPQQHCFVQPVLLPEIRLGFEEAVDIEDGDGYAIHFDDADV